MSALKLGCEGLGPAETSGVVYPWLSQSTVYPNPDPRRGPGDTLQVWVPSPLRSVPSGFLCDCLISPEPNKGLHRAGAGTPHGLELNKNPSYVSSQLTIVFREEGKGVERKERPQALGLAHLHKR